MGPVGERRAREEKGSGRGLQRDGSGGRSWARPWGSKGKEKKVLRGRAVGRGIGKARWCTREPEVMEGRAQGSDAEENKGGNTRLEERHRYVKKRKRLED